MNVRARAAWPWAAAWIGAASAGTLLLGAEGGRCPVSQLLVVAGVLVPALAVGVVLNRFRWSLLGLLYLPLILIAVEQTQDFLLVLTIPFAVAAAALALVLGVVLRRWLAHRQAVGPLVPALAVLGIAVALLPPAVAYRERHRVVRVRRERPLLLDENRGKVAGVGLGDDLARVRAAFGHPVVRGPHDPSGPLAQRDDFFRGPPVLPSFERERDFAYPRLYFAANAGRVRYLEVVDRSARLSTGVGPGDSMSLVRHAYPRLTCDDGEAGEDEPVPYPRCYGWLAPRVYAYFSGDYGKPGAPMTEIWLANFSLAGG